MAQIKYHASYNRPVWDHVLIQRPLVRQRTQDACATSDYRRDSCPESHYDDCARTVSHSLLHEHQGRVLFANLLIPKAFCANCESMRMLTRRYVGEVGTKFYTHTCV
jgi:hypothetical protein